MVYLLVLYNATMHGISNVKVIYCNLYMHLYFVFSVTYYISFTVRPTVLILETKKGQVQT